MRDNSSMGGRRRAIVLIMTLAIMTFLLMLAAMLVTTSVNVQRRAAFYYWSAAAHEAAVAGAVFAQTELEANLAWMASRQPGRVVSTSLGNLQVTQDFDQQTVQGFITSQTNHCTHEFRISFNRTGLFPNDGKPSEVTSRNNMLADIAFPYHNGLTNRSVPKRTAEILVEGITRAAADGTVLARRTVEVGFYRAAFMPAAASGGTIQVSVDPGAGAWKLAVAAGVTGAPGLRSMGDINLYANDASQFSTAIGQPFLPNSQGFYLRGAGSASTLGAQMVNRADNAQQIALTAVTFDQVKTANPKGSLPAGTYVYWSKDDATPTYYPSLSYTPSDPAVRYVFNANDRTVSVIDPQGSPVGSPHAAAATPSAPYSGFWGNGLTVNLTGSIDVSAHSYQDSSNNTVTSHNVAILAAPSTTDRVTFQFAAGQGVVLQNSNPDGGITLRGEVSGTGSIVARGDIAFEGHSALSPNPDAVVTMYSGGSTSLTPILNQAGSVDTQTLATVPSGSATPTTTIAGAASVVLGQYAQTYLQAQANGSLPGDGKISLYGKEIHRGKLMVRGDIARGGQVEPQETDNPLYDLTEVIKAYLDQQSPPVLVDTQTILATLEGQLKMNGGIWTVGPSPGGGAWTVAGSISPSASPTTSPTPNPTTGATTSPGPGSSPAGAASYADQEFRGLIYACKNFSTRLPPSASVSIQGAIVAYGGDPTRSFSVNDPTTWPGNDGTGQMLFTGKNVTFTYDPTYLGGLYSLFPAGPLCRSFYTSN